MKIIMYIVSPEKLSKLLSKPTVLEHSQINKNPPEPEQKLAAWLVTYNYMKNQNNFVPEVLDEKVRILHEYSQYTPQDFADNLAIINQIVDSLIQYNFVVDISTSISNISNSIAPPSKKSSTQKILESFGKNTESNNYLTESKMDAMLAVYERVAQRNHITQKALPPVNLPPLPLAPVIIFGEIHTDKTTGNILKKLVNRLKEKGYERYYQEAPQGLLPSDLSKENSTLNEMEHHGFEIRAIDVAALDEEERRDFTAHFLNEKSALAEARNSTMAWHYAHAEAPVVGVVGLKHLSEIQKKLVAHRPDTANLENNYLCVYAHSEKPRLAIEMTIVAGATQQDYPLGILEIDTSSPEGEDKAVELIIKKIEEKILILEQENASPSSISKP